MARKGLMDDTGYHGFDKCRNWESCNEDIYNRVLDKIMNMLDDLAHTPPKYLQGNETDVWHDALKMAYKELKKMRGGKNE